MSIIDSRFQNENLFSLVYLVDLVNVDSGNQLTSKYISHAKLKHLYYT